MKFVQIPFLEPLFKMINFHSGALLLISAPSSFGLVEAASLIFQGVDQRDIIVPVFLSAGTFFLYTMVFLGDFFTGLKASSKEARDQGRTEFIESSKLWRSFWKFYGVFSILFVFTGFALMLTVFESRLIYNCFLFLIPAFMLMAILFEYHSIGENHKRRFGVKPAYYAFFDKLAITLEEGILTKIKRIF